MINSSCDGCERSKQAHNTKLGYLASDYATRPFQCMFCDYIGQLPRSRKGRKLLLVITDASQNTQSCYVPAKNSTTFNTIGLFQHLTQRDFSHILGTHNSNLRTEDLDSSRIHSSNFV